MLFLSNPRERIQAKREQAQPLRTRRTLIFHPDYGDTQTDFLQGLQYTGVKSVCVIDTEQLACFWPIIAPTT
jgi:hypothetical protein